MMRRVLCRARGASVVSVLPPPTPFSRGDASVAELAEPFAMSQPAISKHLKVLERAGLISTAQDAQRRPRRIEGVRLGEATAWLEEYRQFWERRYSALDELLGQLQAKAPKSKRKRH
jgi:DNA-binding transcriptional ArsR family regulator